MVILKLIFTRIVFQSLEYMVLNLMMTLLSINRKQSSVDVMNNISSDAQNAIMNGDIFTAKELEKEYNSKEREVMLYEWDFITDNLDSYMSALLLKFL